MSAYLVSSTTIDIIVSFAIENKLYMVEDDSNSSNGVPVTVYNATQFGKMLLRENIKSLAYRYPNDYEEYFNNPGVYADNYVFTKYNNVNLAGALGCANNYDYQACEHPDYRKSNSRDFIMTVISSIADKLAKQYIGETPWGVDADTVRKYAEKDITVVSTLKTPGKRRGRPPGSKNKPKVYLTY